MEYPIDEDHVFNFKLCNSFGLYQILNPNTVKLYNHNAYHVIVVVICVYMFSSMIPSIICIRNFMNDTIEFTYYIGLIEQILFVIYKMLNIVYYSNDIWKFIANTRFETMSSGLYDINIFKHWQKHSVNIAITYVIMFGLIVVIWTLNPFIFNTSKVSLKNADNSYNYYRLNIYNIYLPVSDELYNKYFIVFFIIDLTVAILFSICAFIYDIYMVMACYTLICQLEIINDGLRTLGHKHKYSAEHYREYTFFFFNIILLCLCSLKNHTYIF